jgi:predicted Zn-dependent peptidase
MKEVLLEPAFEQDRLDLMKKAAIQQIESRNDSVTGIAAYQLPLLLFGENHFAGRLLTKPAIEAVTREDLKALHARLVHPKNMVLAVSGRFDRAAMLKTLNQVFGTLTAPAGAMPSPTVPVPDFVRKPGIYVSHKEVPQSVVAMTLPGLRRSDPDWFPCLVANEILGGTTQAARLMRKLRSDEGLTYGVYSQFGQGPFYRGDWTVQLQTKNRSVPYAMKLILEQIDRMKNEPVSDEDLKVVKGILVDAFPNQFESAQAVANGFANDAAIGWPEGYIDTFRQKVQAVTKEDIQRVAKKYFDMSKAVVLVAGNAQEAQAGDEKDHPGRLDAVLPLPVTPLPLK